MTAELPEPERFALAARPAWSSARSWYEAAEIGPGRMGMVLGEPADHVRADGLRGLGSERLRAGQDPAEVVGALARAAGSGGGRAVCAVLDADDGLLHWAATGGAAPLVVTVDGAGHLRARRGAATPIAPGSTVALHTGPPGAALVAAAAPHAGLGPAELASVLFDELAGAGPAEPALLLARLVPAPLVERLPADPRLVPAVRRALRTWCELAGLSEDAAADLALLLSEAATNAVEHAYRGVEPGEWVYSVRRRGDGGVRVEVQDFGRWRPPPAEPGYRGRGLAVIRNLATDVVLEPSDAGTRIAFTVADPLVRFDGRPAPGLAGEAAR